MKQHFVEIVGIRTTVDFFRPPANCPVTSYYWSGFSTLQAIIDQVRQISKRRIRLTFDLWYQEWLKWKEPNHVSPDISLQMLPKIAFTSSE